ncbi:protein phosphatase methylesterase [Exidia glandulosa HHB12029]|uniref:Protein phosphatase methylesterase 1 n=1 Tax=Exidia glandulosa HHB12029 TaxID=1314781 RepID=A0A165QHP5_EXIGL|nr:protein phosphatase methylesterase [Exidia glandulosa HHB12029]
MSNLARSAMSARLAKLPPMPPSMPGDDEDGDEEGNTVGELPSLSSKPARPKKEPNPFYAPLSASSYFAQALQVAVPDAGLDVRVYHTPPTKDGGTVIVCHHGAGYSALSFALFAKEVAQLSAGECGVLALDARAHGELISSTTTAQELDLSLERLSADFVHLVKALYPNPAQAPSFLFVGHSMGGAVVVDACPVLLDLKYRVVGVTVIDVVEGSALDALPHMHALLANRPTGFETVEEAVEWHLHTHAIRNVDAARVSIPAILTPSPDGQAQTWRAPLGSTAPFWESWFTGLSRKFLATRAARLLILAGTDRLDKELMIGQLQGKFQLVIIPEVGHLVQEDDPARTAEIVVEFWRRNDRVVPGVKKVGEL